MKDAEEIWFKVNVENVKIARNHAYERFPNSFFRLHVYDEYDKMIRNIR